MQIAVLGANGFIGSEIVKTLSTTYKVTKITRKNYNSYVGREFDILINANGNSKKYWAEKNPIQDFESSVSSVFKSIYDFKFKKYIYLSSLDAYGTTVYGRNKKLAEELLWDYRTKLNYDFFIIRLGMVLGQNQKKGVVYDILNDKELWVHPQSKFQFISVRAVSEFIAQICDNGLWNHRLNLAGMGSITIPQIEKILDKKAIISNQSTTLQEYNYNVVDTYLFYPLKTSPEYLKEVINEK